MDQTTVKEEWSQTLGRGMAGGLAARCHSLDVPGYASSENPHPRQDERAEGFIKGLSRFPSMDPEFGYLVI